MIPEEQLANALRTILKLNAGFYIGFSLELLEIGQLENCNYWVASRDHHGNVLWQADDLPLEQAIHHFLRIRHERQLGYDIEEYLHQKGESTKGTSHTR